MGFQAKYGGTPPRPAKCCSREARCGRLNRRLSVRPRRPCFLLRLIVQALWTTARRPCERRCRGRCRQESPPSCGWADRGRRPARLPTQGPCRLRTAGRHGKIISWVGLLRVLLRSEEHTSELQSLIRHSYDSVCLTQNKTTNA